MGNFTYASARLHASSVLAKAAARQNHIGSLPSPDDLLDNCVEYVRLFDLEELVAYISHMTCLPNDVSSEIGMLVIDSFTMPLRNATLKPSQRSTILSQLLADIRAFARNNDVAVVLTGQGTFKYYNQCRSTEVVLPFGDALAQKIDLQLMVDSIGGSK
ncbi:hypothetical protein EV182_004257, partial [Spiromyces aspiralis]